MRWHWVVWVVGLAVVAGSAAERPVGWPVYLSNFQPPEGLDWASFRVAAIDGMPQVLVPAGEFLMGSPAEEQEEAFLEASRSTGRVSRETFDAEGPRQRVRLSACWMDLHEVTVAQYCRFLNAVQPSDEQRQEWVAIAGERQDNLRPPQIGSREGRYEAAAGQEHHPVVWVTWYGAAAYAAWAGRALPTEAQWERAARGGQQTRYAWGDNPVPPAGVGNHGGETAYPTTSPVARYRPNAFGLCDLEANVAEWCQDLYTTDWYHHMPTEDPVNLSAEDDPLAPRVLRGGAWYDSPKALRVARRGSKVPEMRHNWLGFRCVVGE